MHFDWGLAENLVRYGQTTPPPYTLEHVTCPVVLAWSDNDLLADPQVRRGVRGSPTPKQDTYKQCEQMLTLQVRSSAERRGMYSYVLGHRNSRTWC